MWNPRVYDNPERGVYDPERLEILIHEKPLNKEAVQSVLDSKIIRVTFSDLTCHCALLFPFGDDRYSIVIKLRQSPEEQKISLIHEIIHVYYRANGEEIEEIVEREAQLFCKQNEEFVEELYTQLRSSPIN